MKSDIQFTIEYLFITQFITQALSRQSLNLNRPFPSCFEPHYNSEATVSGKFLL